MTVTVISACPPPSGRLRVRPIKVSQSDTCRHVHVSQSSNIHFRNEPRHRASGRRRRSVCSAAAVRPRLRFMDDPDATGEHISETWSLADARSEQFEQFADDDFDAQSIASSNLDVRSMASSNLDVMSLASGRSIRSATATYGDHLTEASTAYTTGAAVPLAAVPSMFLSRRVTDAADSDTASVMSVNTRRGWPRVAPGGPASSLRPVASPLVHERGSYRDAVLRECRPSPQPDAAPAASAAPRANRGPGSGWVLLPRRRQPVTILTSLAEEAEEPVVAPRDSNGSSVDIG